MSHLGPSNDRASLSPGYAATSAAKVSPRESSSLLSRRDDLCLPALVTRRARQSPNAVAILDGASTATYQELDKRSSEFACLLRSRGVTRNVVVGILAERSIVSIVAALGIMKAGGAFLPLDPADPTDRLRYQLEDSEAGVVVTTETFQKKLGDRSKHILLSDTSGRPLGHEARPALLEVNVHASDLAYVIYTSGSTGRPKGVEVTHGNLSNLVTWYCDAFDVTEVDRASHVAPVGFDAAVMEVWPYVAAGSCVCVANNSTVRDPESLRDWIGERNITIGFAPTALAERLMEMHWPPTTSLRIMLTGGDVLHRYPPATLPFQVVNNYGPTECTVVATSGVAPPSINFDTLPPIGRPTLNTSIYVVDESGHRVDVGEPGEIWIGGSGVARGYRNAPQLTAEKFIPDPFDPRPGARAYRTGDLGRLLPDGQIAFLGRIDEQIQVRGFRVEPGEIEAQLNEHPSVLESAVTVLRHDPGDDRLTAYLVLAQQHAPAAEEIQGFLAERLPKYMIPSEFRQLSTLPVNRNGKVDRAALGRLESQHLRQNGSYVAPRTTTEKRLMGIVAPLLRRDNISVEDNFFLLGGHSLLGTQLIARLRDAFGVELSLRFLFESATLANLACEIERLLRVRVDALSAEEVQRMLREECGPTTKGT